VGVKDVDHVTSVADLEARIDWWISHWNDNPEPFIWTRTTEEIIDKVTRSRAALDWITRPASPNEADDPPSHADGGRTTSRSSSSSRPCSRAVPRYAKLRAIGLSHILNVQAPTVVRGPTRRGSVRLPGYWEKLNSQRRAVAIGIATRNGFLPSRGLIAQTSDLDDSARSVGRTTDLAPSLEGVRASRCAGAGWDGDHSRRERERAPAGPPMDSTVDRYSSGSSCGRPYRSPLRTSTVCARSIHPRATRMASAVVTFASEFTRVKGCSRSTAFSLRRSRCCCS
jgi:hypothetical protein